MKNTIFIKISLLLSLCLISFIAVYSLIIDYQFPQEQVNYLFSMLYLVLALNFLGQAAVPDNQKERLNLIILRTQNIIISCVLMIIYALILLQSKVSFGKIFLILLLSLLLYYSTLVFFKRKVTLFLFWINFYLFMGVFVFYQFPNFQIDFISKYNPFGGLIVNLIM
jgi:O-antigen ligase